MYRCVTRGLRVLGFVLLGLGAASCASQVVCDPNDHTHMRCSYTGGPAEAAATAGIAAAAWVAVGCTVNGCAPPYVCNYETKKCEPQRCGEGVGSCPPGYRCHPQKHVCW